MTEMWPLNRRATGRPINPASGLTNDTEPIGASQLPPILNREGRATGSMKNEAVKQRRRSIKLDQT